MGAMCTDTMREILTHHLDKAIGASMVFTENARRNTVQERDVRQGLNAMGRHPVFGDSHQVIRKVGKAGDSTRTVTEHAGAMTKRCKGYHAGTSGKKGTKTQRGGYQVDDDQQWDEYGDDDDDEYEVEDEDYEEGDDADEGDGQMGGAKSRRFKPGTVALRKMRFYQKQSGHCFNIPKRAFGRLVREMASQLKPGIRFSPDAIMILQVDTESCLIELFHNANLQAIHAKRVRVQPSDIDLAHQMQKHHH